MYQALLDYYGDLGCPLGEILEPQLWGAPGYFRFGTDLTCYGQCQSGVAGRIKFASRYDARRHSEIVDSCVRLPFSIGQVIENLRLERYAKDLIPGRERVLTHEVVLKAYYSLRSLLPVSIRRYLQRAYFSDWRSRPFPSWPVDYTVDRLHEELLQLSMRAAGVHKVPFIWFWPDGASSCLMMTHDVETCIGRDFTPQLMDIDEAYGISASFQVIPEKRYEVTADYIGQIKQRGFEVNVHDLNHDGRLYRERVEFLKRARTINEYSRTYDAKGFRAGAMYRNLDWYEAYEFSYDMSVPNVAHLEPKRGGCCTVMPFFVGRILELPLTTIQDYSLFHILKDYSIEVWKEQLRRIRQRNGLISFITHPDYLIEAAARKVYESLLDYLGKMMIAEKLWMALPHQVDRWWRARRQMKLVRTGTDWEVIGPQSERARVAFAVLDGQRLTYEFADTALTMEKRS